MRGTELYRGFVPQSEDFYISINSSYWVFAGKEVESSREKNCHGKAPNLVKV
jgi:hypothetical protein